MKKAPGGALIESEDFSGQRVSEQDELSSQQALDLYRQA
jgi:hypothetical protein